LTIRASSTLKPARAPKGLARQLVDKVLKVALGEGLTVRGVYQRAQGMDGRVTLKSVYNVLSEGNKHGRYALLGNLWFEAANTNSAGLPVQERPADHRQL
jgi:hypothetical protein